ncbi:rho-associated protein kinase 1-like [Sparus aurata]|uniref:rho-associated protein kinase 1-like n=1 Tax=Sparus aurata TaxID=8175 RepID=UPI0011C1193B|nr:rho-associated protein kinase 1-like [Sparus aurata]
MRYILLAALVIFPTWKYENMDQDTMKSQDKEKESEKALTTLTEQMQDNQNLTVQLQPQFQKNSTKQNQKDQIDDTMDDIIEKEKEELVKKNTQLQKELLNKDKHWEDKVTILMEEKTELENQRDSLKQRLDELEKEKEINKQKLQAVEKNNTMQNQKDRLFFNPAFTALNLDTVFFILLIHTCGASQHSSKKEGKKQDSNEIKAKPQHLEKTKIILFLYLWRLLENHRELFKLQLEDVEREREDNKEKIQSVEKLITESEREKATEKTEEILREKQNLLSAQWKLEWRKEELEKLQLNTEKVLQREEADGLLTRMTERKENLEKKVEGT